MLSVVIPVLDEERILKDNTQKILDFFKEENIDGEVILCDNGSTDKTPIIASDIASKNEFVKFIQVPKRRAVGDAFREGVLIAQHENIISLDMDLSTAMDFIPRSIHELKENSMVIGSKKEAQKRKTHRVIISSTYIQLVKMLLGFSFNDFSMAAKAYKKSDIQKYLNGISSNSSYVLELAHDLTKEGKDISEIPVMCEDKRKSKFNIWKEVYVRLTDLIRLKFRR